MKKTGYKISKVEINDVEKKHTLQLYFLEDNDGNEIEIDSRPSDAIAIAIRIDAPIYVTANVLSNGSVSTDSAKDQEEAEEFKNFVQKY